LTKTCQITFSESLSVPNRKSPYVNCKLTHYHQSAGLGFRISATIAGGLTAVQGGGVMIGSMPSSRRLSTSRSAGAKAAGSVTEDVITRPSRMRLRLFSLITR
jgi:hypothetical protein